MILQSDFIIIGAGIVGLIIAHELKQRHPNLSIAVLKKDSWRLIASLLIFLLNVAPIPLIFLTQFLLHGPAPFPLRAMSVTTT